MTRSLARLFAAAAITLCLAPAALAQDDDDPAVLKPAEPDFALGSLPTNLRLPLYKSAFRLTEKKMIMLLRIIISRFDAQRSAHTEMQAEPIIAREAKQHLLPARGRFHQTRPG